MGSRPKVQTPPPPPAPPPTAPRAGRTGETGSVQRRQRMLAKSRQGIQQSILAGETGGAATRQDTNTLLG